jgi:hypothetical protein
MKTQISFRILRALGLGVALTLCGSAAAHAQTPVLTSAGTSVTINYNSALGYSFSLSSDAILDTLGFYFDSASPTTVAGQSIDTLGDDITVSLFTTTSQTALATVTFASGTTGLQDSFVYLAPTTAGLTLTAGTEYVLSVISPDPSVDLVLNDNASSVAPATSPEVTLGDELYGGSYPNTDPQNSTSFGDSGFGDGASDTAYVGANMQFTAVAPEPSTYALLIGGLIFLAARFRRRSA